MEKNTLKGGEFLIKDTEGQGIFIPEQFNEEQLMMAETCSEFIDKTVIPAIPQLEKHDRQLLSDLMAQAGELGLLSVSIPEEYEGFGQNYVTSMRVTEEVSRGFSFSVAYSAHTGISTLPILYYGNEAQKKKYLPKLGSGEWVGSYCLTEPGAGSDANSGKTKAVLNSAGTHYVINGQKMWITNGGIAELFIVFAKIDDDKNLSAFIVEKGFGGITINPEEEKMGIKGSSTVQIFFNDCPVPVENMLGERNEGFKIALNILNIGRLKLAAGAVGACKGAIKETIVYAIERKQFGTSISNFPAIKHKIAEQVMRLFVTESAVYRSSQWIDDAVNADIAKGMEKGAAYLEAMRQYAIEAAMLKVYGSETLDFVVDEAVQVYGGMGYSAETLVERAYRDSRINRIFEGTNEINRMVMIGEILKRTMKGELDLIGPAMAVGGELMQIPDFGTGTETWYEQKKKYLKNFKKVFLLASGSAVKKYGEKLSEQQELLFNAADIMMQIYMAESAMLRVQKLESMRGEEAVSLYKSMLDVFFYDAADIINKAGRDAINSFAEGDEQSAMLMGVKRFTKVDPVNVVTARRAIADLAIAESKYPF